MLLKLILDYLRYIKFLIKYYLINLFKFKKSLNTHDRSNYQEYLNKQLEKTTNQKKRDVWLEENYYNNKTNKFIHFFLKHKDILHNSKKTLSIGSRVGNEVLAIKSYGCECIGIDLVPYKDLVIKEKQINNKKLLIEEVKNSKAYKNIIENFPDAELIDVKIKKDEGQND